MILRQQIARFYEHASRSMSSPLGAADHDSFDPLTTIPLGPERRGRNPGFFRELLKMPQLSSAVLDASDGRYSLDYTEQMLSHVRYRGCPTATISCPTQNEALRPLTQKAPL